MGVDKRTKSLDGLTREDLQTLLSTLFFAMDDVSFAEQKKIALAQFFTPDPVDQDSQINYLGLTPKAFAASKATNARDGIVRFASDLEITNKANSVVVAASAMHKAIFANTEEILNITDENKATYTQAFTGAETLNPDLHFNRFGTSILVGGRISAVNSGLNFSKDILIYFKNISMPKYDQSACVVTYINERKVQCPATWYFTGINATLAIAAPSGFSFVGTNVFYISFQYITA